MTPTAPSEPTRLPNCIGTQTARPRGVREAVDGGERSGLELGHVICLGDDDPTPGEQGATTDRGDGSLHLTMQRAHGIIGGTLTESLPCPFG